MSDNTTVDATTANSVEMIDEGANEIGMGERSRLMLAETGPVIRGDSLGTAAVAMEATTMRIIKLLVDDSGSISASGNTSAVRDGVDGMLRQWRLEEQNGEKILVSMSLLNGGLLFPFLRPSEARLLSEIGFYPDGKTPLRDRLIEAIAEMVGKIGEASMDGIKVYSSVISVGDGFDEGSERSVDDCRTVVTDFLGSDHNQVQAVGVMLQGSQGFKAYFGELGIKPHYVHESSSDPKAISDACKRASRLSNIGSAHVAAS